MVEAGQQRMQELKPIYVMTADQQVLKQPSAHDQQ